MKHSHRILIVEDEEFLVLALQDNLEADGYKVDIAADGSAAIESMREHHPDLVLLDLLLPKQNGFFVLEEVSKHPELSQIPIIVLSNLGNDSDIKRALSLGAVDYFVKSQHMLAGVLVKVELYMEGIRDQKPHASLR